MKTTKILGVLLLTLLLPSTFAAQQTAELEIDHLFVFVSPNAPEASLLRDAGFLFVPDTSIHRGQGTASLSCLFENVYLELIWKQGEGEDPLGLSDRANWRETGAAPIGVGLRRIDTLVTQLPFETWRYEAPWMQPGTAIEVASNEPGSADPLFFVVPPYMAFSSLVAGASDMLRMFQTHQIGVRRLTAARVLEPSGGTESAARPVLERAGLVAFESGGEFALELTFDGGQAGERIDFRPDIPLIVIH